MKKFMMIAIYALSVQAHATDISAGGYTVNIDDDLLLNGVVNDVDVSGEDVTVKNGNRTIRVEGENVVIENGDSAIVVDGENVSLQGASGNIDVNGENVTVEGETTAIDVQGEQVNIRAKEAPKQKKSWWKLW